MKTKILLILTVFFLLAYLFYTYMSSDKKTTASPAPTTALTPTTSVLLRPYAWLLHDWKMMYQGTEVTESWSVVNDTLWEAHVTMVAMDGSIDTFEYLRLYPQADQLVYLSQVKNQNEGRSIPFLIELESDQIFQAKNPAHDFPQLIEYKRKQTDSLLVKLGGEIEGKWKEENFVFTKIKTSLK